MSFTQNFERNYVTKMQLEREILKFTLQLYNNPQVPRNLVQEIIENISNLIADYLIPHLQYVMAAELKNTVNSTTQAKINIILDENRLPFYNYATEHKRFKNYSENSLYSPPEEFEIGVDEGTLNSVTAVHIPLEKTLQTFLNLPGMYVCIKNYMATLEKEDEVISNVIQGKLWKKKYYNKNRNVLPLCIFFDDLETGNPLGSHSGERKFGNVYCSLPCLPPHLAFKVTNVFLSTIFYAHHRATFGNKNVFAKVITDLQYLSDTGINVKSDGIEEKVYFDCILVVGDNLGLNGCCGFQEYFNGGQYCRICRATHLECKELVIEQEALVRTKSNYELDLQNKSGGIKQECVFNSLPGFHIGENRTVDLMHDIFEGVARYTIENILTTFIMVKKYFSVDEFNLKLEKFDFGAVETSSKPRNITTEACSSSQKNILKSSEKVRVKQSAAEMVCLSRYLGLIIDDLLPHQDEYWTLYILLRQIIGIVTAPRFLKADIYTVRDKIASFLTLYKRLYENLTPKFHMMIHIPRLMYENGPLINFWVMTFERKHRDYKRVAVSTSSAKNLPLTMGIRNQLQLSYRTECFSAPNSDVTLGSIKSQDATTEIRRIKNLPCDTSAKSYKYITIMGKRYETGTIFFHGFTEDKILFSQLENIYVINTELFLHSRPLTTVDFDNNYHAYRVEISEVPMELIPISEIYRDPPCLVVKKNNNFYVAMRYDV